jgi:hypothetical protein
MKRFLAGTGKNAGLGDQLSTKNRSPGSGKGRILLFNQRLVGFVQDARKFTLRISSEGTYDFRRDLFTPRQGEVMLVVNDGKTEVS